MKVNNKNPKEFEPVRLILEFETQEEVDWMYLVFNAHPLVGMVESVREKSAEVRDALGDCRDNRAYQELEDTLKGKGI